MLPPMQPGMLLQLINHRHRVAFSLGERYAGGEQGAFAVTDPAGRPFVLKWSAGAGHLPGFQRAQAITEHLRGRGYPAPRYLHLGAAGGHAYAVLEALPGAPLGVLTDDAIPRLLALNDLQVGPAPVPPTDWPAAIVQSVLVGCEGYCELSSLRSHSVATAGLLVHLQTLVARQGDIPCPTGDIVHYDFTPANILASDGRISGVIDWEGSCAGDRAFDLATLLFYGYEQPVIRERLLRAALDRATPAALTLYLAHLIVRQVDWSIRHHTAQAVARWLRVAQAITRDMFPPPAT